MGIVVDLNTITVHVRGCERRGREGETESEREGREGGGREEGRERKRGIGRGNKKGLGIAAD